MLIINEESVIKTNKGDFVLECCDILEENDGGYIIEENCVIDTHDGKYLLEKGDKVVAEGLSDENAMKVLGQTKDKIEIIMMALRKSAQKSKRDNKEVFKNILESPEWENLESVAEAGSPKELEAAIVSNGFNPKEDLEKIAKKLDKAGEERMAQYVRKNSNISWFKKATNFLGKAFKTADKAKDFLGWMFSSGPSDFDEYQEKKHKNDGEAPSDEPINKGPKGRTGTPKLAFDSEKAMELSKHEEVRKAIEDLQKYGIIKNRE